MRISVRLPTVSFLVLLLAVIFGSSGLTSAQFQLPGAGLEVPTQPPITVAPFPPEADAFVHIAGVYDQFNPIDFDSHVLSGTENFSWLAKVDTTTGIATWATKVHSGSGAVNQLGAGGPYIVAHRGSGDIYAAVCASMNAGPGNVVNFYQVGSMAAAATRTTTLGSHVYLVKYNRHGVLQWVRHTKYTTVQFVPDAFKFMTANMPNLCMLPSGNVVLGASVKTGNDGLPSVTTVKWSDGTTDVDVALLGETGTVQGVLLEIDPAGNFVSSKISECTGGFSTLGSPNTPVILSPIGTRFGFAAGHLRNFRAAIRLGVGEANEFTSGFLSVDSGVNGHCARYDPAKRLRWTAATVPMNSGGNPLGPNAEPISVWCGSFGSVYSTDLLFGQTSQPDLRAHVQSAGFSDVGSIDVAMPAAGAGSGEGAPVYEKRNGNGQPQWAKGFGPSSVFGDDLPRPITIFLVGDVPWIAGVVRKNVGERLFLDEGLSSEVQLRGDVAPFPRAFLAKLNRSSGRITQMITFLGEAGQPGFGVASGNQGDIRQVDAVFRGHPLGTSKLAVIFDHANTRITIGGTNLDPIAATKSFAPFAIFRAATGAVLVKKRYPTSVQEPMSTVRAVSLTSAER